MTLQRFRRKPAEADMIHWDGSDEAMNLIGWHSQTPGAPSRSEDGALFLWVAKSHAVMRLEPGDWAVIEPDGSGVYPLTAGDQEALYEPVDPTGAATADSPASAGAGAATAGSSSREPACTCDTGPEGQHQAHCGMSPEEYQAADRMGLLESAWGWQEAAVRWRDRYHAMLRAQGGNPVDSNGGVSN